MKNTATFRRTMAVIGLVATAALSLLSNLTAPAFPPSGAARLAAIDEHLTTSAISAASFVLAQLPFVAAALGVAHLLRRGAPALSNIGATLGVIGAFGHAVFGGVSLVFVAMAAQPANRELYGRLVEDFETTPAMVFAALGLIGTVLSLLLLAVGLWRAGVGPRWVPGAIGLFIVVEFVGSGLSDWAGQVSGVIYLVALLALAVTVARTPAYTWGMPSEASSEEPLTVRG